MPGHGTPWARGPRGPKPRGMHGPRRALQSTALPFVDARAVAPIPVCFICRIFAGGEEAGCSITTAEEMPS